MRILRAAIFAGWRVTRWGWRRFRMLSARGQVITALAFTALLVVSALTSEPPVKSEVRAGAVEDALPRATHSTARRSEPTYTVPATVTTEFVAPTTAAPVTAPPTVVTTAAPTPRRAYSPPPTSPPATSAQSRGATAPCHPSYSPCIPDEGTDVDCAGGSGNGPRYVSGPVDVHGPDEYDLDHDHNGIGCESG